MVTRPISDYRMYSRSDTRGEGEIYNPLVICPLTAKKVLQCWRINRVESVTFYPRDF